MIFRHCVVTILFCFSFCASFEACVTTSQQDLDQTMPARESGPQDKLLQLYHEVTGFIVKKYFIPGKKENIEVNFSHSNVNCAQEPLVAEYIADRLQDKLSTSPQFTLTDDETSQDCTLRLHIEHTDADLYLISVSVTDRETAKKMFSKKLKATKDELNKNEYTLYAANYLEKKKQDEEKKKAEKLKKKDFEKRIAEGLARLYVKVKLEGSTRYLDTYYSSTPSTYSYEHNSNSGSYQYTEGSTDEVDIYDTSYPKEVKLFFEGKEYKMDTRSNVLYEEYITPGHYTCYVAYKPCDYYGEERVEKCLMPISRKVELEIKRDEFVVVHILASYQGSDPTLLVRVKRQLLDWDAIKLY